VSLQRLQQNIKRHKIRLFTILNIRYIIVYMKIIKLILDFILKAFGWFVSSITLLLLSPVLLIIGLPLLVLVLFLFSIFITVFIAFLVGLMKIVLVLGVPALIVYLILKHFDIV
jgi:hypothetical protein